MTTLNKTAAFKALDTFASSRVKLIQSLHDAGYTLETARNVVIEWACAKTGAEFRWNKAETKAMLVTSSTNYEGAKTVVRDVMLMIQGTTRRESSGATEKDPVEQAIKALSKLTPAQLKKVLAAVAK
jgi:hypothetical protein